MGVSLERVQFKFASIIGELCNEPDVLSQFAVWLDIRLAEYKLKGAISLDCSGEEPDADWMNGLSKCKKYSANKRTDRQSSLHSPSLANTGSTYIQDFHSEHHNERLSPEFVVVKEEASDIFPVEVHMNANPTSSQVRKRSSFSNEWSRNSKQRRQNANESPAHQSLMSVIGHMQDETQESGSMGNNSSALISNSFKSSEQVTDIHIHQTQDPVKSPEVVTINIPDEGSLSDATSTQAEGTNYSNNWMMGTNSSIYKNAGILPNCTQGAFLPPKGDDLPVTNMTKKHFIPCMANMSKARAANIMSAVSKFERWIQFHYPEVTCEIKDIPPVKLDSLLKEFFSTVQSSSGQDYSPPSFKSLRCNLEFYLKESGYPISISTSPQFSSSQIAYKDRCRPVSVHVPEANERQTPSNTFEDFISID